MHSRTRSLPRCPGFTLIEVMIVIGIIAILSAIAFPAYQDYILRGKVVDAFNTLSAQRALMEQYYQDNRTYVGGPCTTATTLKEFSIACAAGAVTATTYTITATGTSSATSGFVFTLDQNNRQQTIGLPARWGTAQSSSAAGNTCWIGKKGQTC